MKDLELFIKGLVKTVEGLYEHMVEVGRNTSSKRDFAAEASEDDDMDDDDSVDSKVSQKEFAELEVKIVDALGTFPNGCTLKELAASLSVQWHFLRIPIRHLIDQKKIFKNDKIYSVKSKTEESVATADRSGIKRRIVDAKVLEAATPEKPIAAMPEMSIREKEILKFKTLTAFRGRPEGLTISELTAVLGRSPGGLEVILKELISDKKVIEGKGSKYHLS